MSPERMAELSFAFKFNLDARESSVLDSPALEVARVGDVSLPLDSDAALAVKSSLACDGQRR